MENKNLVLSFVIGLLAVAPAYSQDGEQADAPLVDALNQSNLQDAFRILQRRYVGQEQLSFVEINRAALDGLLKRLGHGAQLVKDEDKDLADTKFRIVSELLSQDVAYIRPARVAGVELKAFDTALRGFSRSPARALVLDLRCPTGVSGGDFTDVAAFAGRFLPKGTSLFTVERAGDQGRPQLYSTQKTPTWKKTLAVLVDGETGSAGEVLAAVLRNNLGCLVIGATTIGLGAEFEEVPIGVDARLRYAVAEAVFEDGTKIFGEGVAPDIACKFDAVVKRRVFLESQTSGVGPFVFEKERARLNEAALVARTNPELAQNLKRSAGEPEVARDYYRVLQSSIDALIATRIFEDKKSEDQEEDP